MTLAVRREATSYDALAPVYDLAYSRPCDLAENAVIRRWLAPQVAAPARVLDLGCGTGLLLDLFPDLPPERYLGIDISGGMLAVARRKHPAHAFRQADIADGPPAGGWPWTSVCLFGSGNYVAPFDLARACYRAGGPAFVMLMTPRRAALPDPPPGDWLPVTAPTIARRWRNLFPRLDLRPFNRHGRRLEGRPGARRWLPTYLRLESRVLALAGRPDGGNYLIIRAT